MAESSRMPYTPRQMTTVELLNVLRGIGARKVSFHADGAVASVEFEDETASAVEPQHETSTPAKPKRRSVGGLVPRDPVDE